MADNTPNPYEYQYKDDYQNDWDVHRGYINQNFDAYEAMLAGEVYDSVSRKVDGSKITDSYATTLAKERADRVVARLPEGQTVPIGHIDVGKAAFLDILRQKWLYPNANAQHPFQMKLNMWQFYSSVYGYMPMFYDWNIAPSGYAGPDCWLWNPRNFIPQAGKTSIEDMDYATALTWVSKPYLEDRLDSKEGGWDSDALRHLISLEEAKRQSTGDGSQDTKIASDRTPGATRKGILLATRFEAGDKGHWITFAPDHGFTEVRRLKNPHQNGRIPFVVKYSQPLFDSFYGMGDFQRAKPLQFARDGLTNFYFKGIKMNLIPPIVANANGVVKHTLDYREGAVMLETLPNSIRRLETSMAGLNTYQAAQSNLTGSLLSLFGSQNASLPGAETLNPSQGKTPAAIDLYSSKEATRDGAERRNLEMAIEQLVDGMFSVLVNVGVDKIPVALFAEDIKDIVKQGYGDIKELFKGFEPNASNTAGRLVIDPKALKGLEFRFNIKTDSTAQLNQQAQLQALLEMMDRIGNMQNVFQSDVRYTVRWDLMMGRYAELSGIPGAEEFISFNPNATSPETMALPGGGQVKPTDLIALYQKTANPQLRQQIIKKFGFDPAGEEATAPEPTVSSSGMMFRDPHLAQAADAISSAFDKPLPAKPASATMNSSTK